MFRVMSVSQCAPVPLSDNRGTAVPLVTDATGARHVDVRLVRLAPSGPAWPYHFHNHSENVYWILSGQGRLTVEGEDRYVNKDDVVFIPPHTRHALSAAGSETLCLLEIFAPAGNDFVPVEEPRTARDRS